MEQNKGETKIAFQNPNTWTADGKGEPPKLGPCPRDENSVGCRGMNRSCIKTIVTIKPVVTIEFHFSCFHYCIIYAVNVSGVVTEKEWGLRWLSVNCRPKDAKFKAQKLPVWEN